MAGSEDGRRSWLVDQDRDVIRAASAWINDLENRLARLGEEVGDGPDLDGLVARLAPDEDVAARLRELAEGA